MNISYSDQELIKLFEEDSPSSRNKAMTSLFNNEKLKNSVLKYLRNKGTSYDIAIDIFKDALITLSLAIKKGNYKKENDIHSYLFGICKYLWLNKMRSKKPVDYKESVPELEISDNPVTKLVAADNSNMISKVLGYLKNPCKDILQLWSYGYKFSEIATKVGYASEGVARKKKHQCWKSLLELLETRSDLKDQLKMIA